MQGVNESNNIEKECRFCYPPDKDRILYQSPNFYIMLSLGPIVEGYLLIISKQHLDCCGSFSDEIASEFDSLVIGVKNILENTYGDCLFYEHGRAGSCLQFSEPNKHCLHAHMHCVPTNLKLNTLVEGTLPVELDSWKSFRDKYTQLRSPYLFVDDGIKSIHFINKEIRKQYLRYLVANATGKEQLWDWITFQGIEKIAVAREKLKPQFDSLHI